MNYTEELKNLVDKMFNKYAGDDDMLCDKNGYDTSNNTIVKKF